MQEGEIHMPTVSAAMDFDSPGVCRESRTVSDLLVLVRTSLLALDLTVSGETFSKSAVINSAVKS